MPIIFIPYTYIGMLDLEPYRFRKRPSHSSSAASNGNKGNKGGDAGTGTGTGHWRSEYMKWKGVYDTYDWTQYYTDTVTTAE